MSQELTPAAAVAGAAAGVTEAVQMVKEPYPEREAAREWFASYDVHFQIKSDDTGADEAAFIADVLDLKPGQAVLDVPCGAGRIAVHLAKRGCRITGVDLTPSYLSRACKRFRDGKLPGQFILCDMRELAFAEQFDAIYNWQGSFGFFREQENLNVLTSLARALRPGGCLLIDQPNREWILRHFRGQSTRGTVSSRTTWNRGQQRVQTHYVDKISRQRWGMSIRLYTPGQFRDCFEQAGLRVVATYGGWDGSEYRRSSRRIIVVGRKLR